MMSALQTVEFVKIDVEGAEFSVLKGMRELIERDKPYIILEFTDSLLRQMSCDGATLINYLSKYNYSLCEICGNGIRIVNKPPKEQWNILGIHKTITLPISLNILAQ